MKTKFKLIPYNPELVEKAKHLRKNMTKAECMVWNLLKRKQIMGFDFDRQRPLLNYIVDFFCYELHLAIEVDGQSHDGNYFYGVKRQNELETCGINFLRIKNEDVIFNIKNAEQTIRSWVENNIERKNKFLNN